MPRLPAPTEVKILQKRKLAALSLAVATLLSTAAMADTRIFIIENSDAYGVDGCLASGAPCGETVASAWCRTHDYSRALDFGEVSTPATKGRPLIGGSAALPPSCTGPACTHQVAITCSR